MQSVTIWQKLIIYFSTPPHMIGEGMSVIGIVDPFLAYPKTEGLLALILLAIGGFFVNRKVRMVKNGSYILRYGMKTEAEITRISNTNLEHNNRTVKEYIFQYVANGRTHHYEYRSAFRRYLKEGDSMAIFYLEDDPKMAFIPRLYNLRIK